MIVKVFFDDFPIGHLRYATETLQDANGNWEGRIVSIGSFSRNMGWDKRYEVSGLELVLEDTEKAFRAMMSPTGDNQYILRKPVFLYDVSDNLIYKGVVSGYSFGTGTFTLRIEDKLLGLRDNVIVGEISENTYLAPPEAAKGTPYSIILGALSAPLGCLKAWKVDTGKYLVAAHHCYSIDNVYDADTGAEITTGWTKDNNADGRCYLLFAAGSADYYYLNVQGMMDTGVLVIKPVDALKLLLAGYTSLSYDATSFAAAQAIMDARHYRIDGAITQAQTVEEVLSDFCLSFNCDFFVGRDGKVYLSMLDWTNLAVIGNYNGDIIGDELPIQVDETKLLNKIKYQYAYNYAIQDFQSKPTWSRAISIARHGEMFDTINLQYVADEVTARDVVQRIALLQQDPARMFTFPLPIDLSKGLELGKLISITHPEALADDYITCRILKIDESPREDFAELTVHDISTIRRYQTFQLDNATTATKLWASATAAEKAKYGYMGNGTTKQFSDGAPAKGL